MKVIDLFAGPGGLGEGFNIAGFGNSLSIEYNRQAIETLRFRKLWREIKGDPWIGKNVHCLNEETISKICENFRSSAEEVGKAAWQAELGRASQREINDRIDESVAGSEDWVLIGGPPCQAYSLAGRARMQSVVDNFDEDHRHFLYREYLKIVANFAPPVFVMENVKGVFSSKMNGASAFERIHDDLSSPRRAIHVNPRRLRGEKLQYDIQPVCQVSSSMETASRYLVNSEVFGIPQRRHRVILVGIRSDIQKRISGLTKQSQIPLESAIADLPTLRSKTTKTTKSWLSVLQEIADPTLRSEISDISESVANNIVCNLEKLKTNEGSLHFWDAGDIDPSLARWYDPELNISTANHEPRGHMPKDLLRYFYASNYAEVKDEAPKLKDFPRQLLPDHKNVREDGTAIFNDRFRVQVSSRPSTTVTSHISKDGHYYIHPDPLQCRSFTVREAARCQTFPDDYFFRGNRTQQYHQVGNAVPPLLAYKIAKMIKNDIF
jgi:DNA (cytosine-5)-methyltransferase 1